MARIALMAVDSEYPNLALMKVSAWHKRVELPKELIIKTEENENQEKSNQRKRN